MKDNPRRYSPSSPFEPTPAENRTDFCLGASPALDSESTSDEDEGVISCGLSDERELKLLATDPLRPPGKSRIISSRSFPGNDDVGPDTDAGLPAPGRGLEALWTDLGVDGPLEVSVDSEASDADGASVALSAVDGRPGFLRDERGGGGGRRMGTAGEEPKAEAGRDE
ncbi:hypothetical protein DICSQDRAFT_128491 [Dichomitus squalens LYAD-421 SS1]|uniref:Uncharacterized protein n=1 Tax=Dichomitus squalens (strain LYAD-421) TaxID=732165 RepID=R7STI1_DICSQ|nr:uncharacterized protein DICSQDRAFT_128491 [Dichomitus squalens LYAD-421 SS1]EJF59055.1 hypothetical protein DICSQDRAFT_128491 [Dichomitus squalens LYAD-421 SS1]